MSWQDYLILSFLFLGRKHFAENIIDGVGVSALFNQFVFLDL